MTKPKDIHDRLFTTETAAASRALEKAFDEFAAEPPRPIFERFFPSLFEGVAEMMRDWRLEHPDASEEQELEAFTRILGSYANGK